MSDLRERQLQDFLSDHATIELGNTLSEQGYSDSVIKAYLIGNYLSDDNKKSLGELVLQEQEQEQSQEPDILSL